MEASELAVKQDSEENQTLPTNFEESINGDPTRYSQNSGEQGTR